MSELTAEEAVKMVNVAMKPAKSERIQVCIDTMLEGLEHGKEWGIEFFEEQLRIKRDRLSFGMMISEVNEQLEKRGYHLTSRGTNGVSYYIAPLEKSSSITSALNRKAMRLLKRSAVFAQSTLREHGGKMDEKEKRRLEKQSQIQAMRYVLMTRMR